MPDDPYSESANYGADGEELLDDEDDGLGPGSADYDLSEDHAYTWEPVSPQVIPQWLMVSVSVLAVVALVAPTIYLIWRYG